MHTKRFAIARSTVTKEAADREHSSVGEHEGNKNVNRVCGAVLSKITVTLVYIDRLKLKDILSKFILFM